MAMEQGSNHDHALGALEARVQILERNHLRLESRIEMQLRDLDARVREMHEVVTSARGSWRALVVLGAITAALASIAATFVHWAFRS